MKINKRQEQFKQLEEIFNDFNKVSISKTIKRLNNLGYKTTMHGKHPKLYIENHCITLCSSPSDCYAGRQILRIIRRLFENIL